MPGSAVSGPRGAANPPGDFLSRTGKRLDEFWRRLSEGLEVQVLWAQFVAEARASYSLYSHELDWEALARETRGRRILKTTSALFWAMLMKLSPARRVFLLIALVLGIFAIFGVHAASSGNNPPQAAPNPVFALLAIGALVFLLALELADRVTMKRDLEIAREIQRWLVPDAPPRIPGLDIAFVSRPANTVGGDYYDAFVPENGSGSPDGNKLMVVVADVAGKSVPASLLMATFQASLRTLAAAAPTLEGLVNGMNRYACAHSLGGRRFTTAFFAELNTTTRALNYIRAGHNAPLLRRTSGNIERLDAGDLPLGIDPAVPYHSESVTLVVGDLLVIFTDGLIEAVNAADQEYGEEKLLEVVKASPGESAQTILLRLLASVDSFVGQTRQHDDITCIVLRAV